MDSIPKSSTDLLCVTLGKSLNLPMPQFPHLYNGYNNTYLPPRDVVRLNYCSESDLISFVKGAM